MNKTHETAKELRAQSLLNLFAHKQAENDEIARLWDTLLSNVTIGEFRIINQTINQVGNRYFGE